MRSSGTRLTTARENVFGVLSPLPVCASMPVSAQLFG